MKANCSARNAPNTFRFLKNYAIDFLRGREGNRGVWIEADASKPGLFFMRSAWADREALDLAFDHPKSKSFRAKLGTFLQERQVIWHATSIASKRIETKLPPNPKVFIRLLKLVILPKYVDEIKLRHGEFSVELLRSGRGCFKFSLYADELIPHILFFESFWESQDHMLKAIESDTLIELRGKLIPFLQERLKLWSLEVIDEDPRYPMLETK